MSGDVGGAVVSPRHTPAPEPEGAARLGVLRLVLIARCNVTGRGMSARYGQMCRPRAGTDGKMADQ